MKLKKYLRTYLILFLISGFIVAVDQVTKALVRQNLAIGEQWAPWDWMLPYVRILHHWNTGVAFGMFQGMNTVFAILAIIVSIAIIYYYPRVVQNDWILHLALGLQLGGAVGNLVDRLAQGFVTDFISVGTFAIFNVADASISVGVAVLVLGVWLQDRRKKPEMPSLPGETSLMEPPSDTPPDPQTGNPQG